MTRPGGKRRPGRIQSGRGTGPTTPRQPDHAHRGADRQVPSPEFSEEKRWGGAAIGPIRPRASRIERLFCWSNDEERLSQGARRRSPPGGRRDRDAARLARRIARPGEIAAEPVGSRIGPGSARRLRRGRRPDPHDEHLGRQPRQAHVPRVGGLARADQSRGRADRARSGGRRAGLRGRIDRAPRRARQAVRLAPADAGARDLRGTGPRPPRGRRRPHPARDVRQPARGGRSGARGAGPLDGDPGRRRDDASSPTGARPSGSRPRTPSRPWRWRAPTPWE